jgi:1,4-alpha-glucan branching enzyme
LAHSKPNVDLTLIIAAKHHNPFAYLGPHNLESKHTFRAFLPYASKVWIQIEHNWCALDKTHASGLFEFKKDFQNFSMTHSALADTLLQKPCQLRIEQDTNILETFDPYSFSPSITADELYLFGEGNLKLAYKTLGAQCMTLQGVQGVRFAVWAPNAERVSVLGDFNRWDGRVNPMRAHGSSGVWELFIPHLNHDTLYKFEIRNRHTGNLHIKTDPFGFSFEARPGTASKVTAFNNYHWQDQAWVQQRENNDWLHAPFNCYELHLGSWRRDGKGQYLSYRDTAAQLIPYLKEMGYTHIELMPVSEHPLNESWGYQTTGYFGVTNRYGTPDDFRYFVDQCHQANIGVILDWVPGHFPKDDWALARYDGTALFEHEDPRLGEHQDWGTYIFNYGRNEVRNFLISNAYYWLAEFHIDGLRVDAVASMLYLDYSRKHGEWLPNKFGGRENLDAIEFLKQLNTMVHQDFPGAFTIAEESTSWPMISRPIYLGGLGFSMKWNMGWMNDTLAYIENDPIHRRYHHNQLTFGQIYAYSENFVLPFSHDEVVHGKHSLLDKMPGDAWQMFANLRLLLTYQMTSPGKKLNFMGNEFGQGREWNVNASLDWHLLDSPWHQGVQLAVKDLNHLYKTRPALYQFDFESKGFAWIDCNDVDQSVISFIRYAEDGQFAIIVLNFTPVPRPNYHIGVPVAGHYTELFNSDAACYGGSNVGNGMGLNTYPEPWMGQNHSLFINLPPLSGLILQIK